MFIAICSTKIKVKQNKMPRSTAVKLASFFEGRKNRRNIKLYLVFFLGIVLSHYRWAGLKRR